MTAVTLARHVLIVAGSPEWPARHAHVVTEALDHVLARHRRGDARPDPARVALLVLDDGEGVGRYAAAHWEALGGAVTHLPGPDVGSTLAALATARSMIGGAGAHPDSTVEVLALPWGRSPRVRALARRAVTDALRVTVLEGTEVIGERPPSARGTRWPR